MEISFINIFGPVLALVAMFFFGRAMVNNSQRQVLIIPSLILILAGILFRAFTGDGTILDRICLILMDFGIAMIIDSRYLAKNKSHPKVFWVPGVLALVISVVIYFFTSMTGLTSYSMFEMLGSKNSSNEKQEMVSLINEERTELMIELGPDDVVDEVKPILDKYGARYEKAFPFVDLNEDEDLAQYYIVNVGESKVEGLVNELNADKENIDHTELNKIVTLDDPVNVHKDRPGPAPGFLSNDPGIGQQWWMPLEQANVIHEMLKENEPIKKARVAILDTGVENDHEDLKGVFKKSPGKGDGNGHGTHCAGLAGAETNNAKGMASLNWEGKFIDILSFKALSKKGSGSYYTIAAAISRAAEADVDVISMSLGGYSPFAPKSILDAIEYARKRNAIVIVAAGNSFGDDAANYTPANVPGVITVAAINSDGRRAEFSNINTSLKMPIAAPGQDIYSTYPGGEYKFLSGTSMATPIVSGLAGILRAYNPDITAEQAWELMNNTGKENEDSREIGNSISIADAISKVLEKDKPEPEPIP